MYSSSRQPSRNTLTAPIRKMRFAWVALFFAGWVMLIGGRLVWLQVIQHSEWMQKAERQQQRTFDVAPRRGMLYDRDLHQLATTVLVDSIYAVPSELGDNRAQAAQMLSRIVHTDPQDGFTSDQKILARF